MNGTNAAGGGEHGGMFNNEGGNDSGNDGKAGNRRLTNMEQQLLAEDGAAAGPAGYYGARGPGAESGQYSATPLLSFKQVRTPKAKPNWGIIMLVDSR